jgi:FkbM family methyltransferase
MLCFDIGANVGAWAKANLANFDKIICVEADPGTYNTLVSLQSEKIEPINYAICDNSGQDITFYSCTTANTISTLNKAWLADPMSRFHKYPYKEIQCKTKTIDDLLDMYGVPDLIKVDVEGGEYSCISSLKRKVPFLCFEWASEVNNITFQCLDHLASLGFTHFFVQFQDNYTFRPTEYTTLENVKAILNKTTPKQEWGMMWCK